jgi:cardiolipin synthase (CMP-forming)
LTAAGAVPSSPPAGPAADRAASETTADTDAGLRRVLTLPNVITATRLACVPVFVWLLFGAHRQTAAAILLGALGATDWVDGFVARRLHQVSTVGKVLDPVADRVLVLTGVLSIIVAGAVPLWFGVATVAREVVVSAAVLLLASLGAERIDVLWVGKAGTFGLMFAYPTFLLAHGHAGWQHPFEIFAWVCGIPGLALAWVAAAAYLPHARRALARGRHGRTRSDSRAAASGSR